jgi:tRNA(fMet)-specific endonuclease VapC
MVCLDTSFIVDFLDGDPKIVRLMKGYLEGGIITTTVISEYELLKHVDKLKRETASSVISSLMILNFDSAAAKEAAEIFAALKKAGLMINELDVLIAGIAKANREVLITRDSGFDRIKSGNIKIV